LTVRRLVDDSDAEDSPVFAKKKLKTAVLNTSSSSSSDETAESPAIKRKR
jgi:hypothetical protein